MYNKYNETMNLNYLRIFNVLYQTQSTTIAAKNLGITQSAVSQTLAKMRQFTGDRLFYINHNTLTPTQRAMTINEGLNKHIQNIDNRLLPTSFLEPTFFHGELTIALSSEFLDSFSSEITNSIIFESLPNTKINITTWVDSTMQDISEGRVHMGVNFNQLDTPQAIRSIPLPQSRSTVIARKGHPWVENGMQQADFDKYPLASCLSRGSLESEPFIQNSRFNLEYRSASISVLNCLAKHSDMLAITDTLSASGCNDDMVCIQPQWLNTILPNSINHALYYREENHHVPLYSFSCEVVKKIIEDKLSQVRAHTIITD